MNPDQDQDGGSLADRAAAWVPPWQRPTDAAEPTEPAPPVSDEADAPTPARPASDEANEPGEAAGVAEMRGLADNVGAAEDAGSAEQLGSAEHDMADEAAAEAAVGADHAAAESEVAPDDAVEAPAAPGDAAAGDADASSANTPVHEQPMLPGLSGSELDGALEAILLVVDEPVTEEQLGDVLDVSAADVADRLAVLAQEYADGGRGFELRRAAGGWRLYTRHEYSAYVERFVLDGQSVRLTQAALETLAVIAYQQPVTRSRISAIRGVNCDGVVRTLVTRGLVEECGIQPESGAHLYQTTVLFLEKLGLDSVDELPPLAPFLPDDVNGLTDAR